MYLLVLVCMIALLSSLIVISEGSECQLMHGPYLDTCKNCVCGAHLINIDLCYQCCDCKDELGIYIHVCIGITINIDLTLGGPDENSWPVGESPNGCNQGGHLICC
eukprot:TRINITY_DN18166_c0_g1_i1.p1 TRINITY_DN18166_c0_g1~~TRINITY_DN18166_c0_g1_i1.p1  ORF type:complete len:106 (-),score=17.06 TRINITY_DN18166_c0_g1_i1:172-489(-)